MSFILQQLAPQQLDGFGLSLGLQLVSLNKLQSAGAWFVA
jgi:hypothetical protein